MRILVLSVCLSFAGAIHLSDTQSAPVPRRDVPKVQTVLVLGDSLAAGYRLARAQAFPALLAKKAGATGFNVRVLNAGVSGDTTAGGLRRLSNLLDHRIDILVLELGINDAFRGVPIEQIRSNLQSIIDRAKARFPSVRILITGMQLPQFSEDDYVRAFGEMFGELAQKNNAALVPFLLKGIARDPALSLPDAIHPNAIGQRILADNVWEFLEPLLRKKP
ncbi:MAG: arylesterase [Verrucomicrobiota bacterium]